MRPRARPERCSDARARPARAHTVEVAQPRDPVLTGLVLAIWVLPVLLATVGLFLVGLPLLAVALVVIEVVVGGMVVLARRR